MGQIFRSAAAACQSKPVAAHEPALAIDVANVLGVLRNCVHERGWTLDALEPVMDLDKSYISRVLNGERPLTLPFLIALPDDIEALFETRRAESLGLIVVAPVSGDAAVRNLVSGLFGVLGAKLAETSR